MSNTACAGMANRSECRTATGLGSEGPYRDAAPRSEIAIAAIARYAGTAACGSAEVGHPTIRATDAVLIRAQAFGPEMPLHDTRLSPGQLVRVDSVRVPAAHLVNGATIVAEPIDALAAYPLDRNAEEIVLAEGLARESASDGGVLGHERDAAPGSRDHAGDASAALQPQLTAIRRTLNARAEALGWKMREDANLTIVADEIELAPFHQSGDRYWFSVPAAAQFRLRSNLGVPAQLVPGLDDWRTLGVAVSEVRIDGDTIDLEGADFGAGFYPVERNAASSWRWTDGDAVLARRFDRPATVEVEVLMIAPSWRAPSPPLRIVG